MVTIILWDVPSFLGWGRCQGHQVFIADISCCPHRNEEDWLVGLGVWFSLRVREVPGSNPGRAHRTYFVMHWQKHQVWDRESLLGQMPRSHGVMVSTLDSESSDPSSNLGGTSSNFLTSSRIDHIEWWYFSGPPEPASAVIAQLGER